MKYFKAILVVSLIFIFPAVSYLYLRSGFIFRKEALEELKVEVPFSDEQRSFLLQYDSTYFDDSDKVVDLFMKVSNEKDVKDMYFIAETFKKRSDFGLKALFKDTSLESYRDTLFSRSITRIDDSKNSNFMDSSDRLYLTKDNLIRHKYGSSQEDFNKAYEHIVILLPMKKREKLTLIRDNEK